MNDTELHEHLIARHGYTAAMLDGVYTGVPMKERVVHQTEHGRSRQDPDRPDHDHSEKVLYPS